MWPDGTVQAVVREHAASVAVVGGGGGHGGAGAGGQGVAVVGGVAAVAGLVARLLLHLVLVEAQEVVQVLDVAHGVPQNLDLAHLLHGGHGGDVLPQDLEPVVEVLDPVPLPLVPLYRLQVLHGLHLVPVDGVDGVLGLGSHAAV